MKTILVVLAGILAVASLAAAQSNDSRRLPFVQPNGQPPAPQVITLQDALQRAKTLDVDVQAAMTDVKVAGEDRQQAKSSLLPSISNSTQYLGTQGNGLTPSGRFVSNDGVHMYREWAVVHEDLTANTFYKTGNLRA